MLTLIVLLISRVCVLTWTVLLSVSMFACPSQSSPVCSSLVRLCLSLAYSCVCLSLTGCRSVSSVRMHCFFMSASCMSASRDSTVYRWCLSVPLSVCLTCVRPSVTVRASLAACLPRLSNCLSLCLSACITGVMPVCLQCLSCLSLCLSVFCVSRSV